MAFLMMGSLRRGTPSTRAISSGVGFRFNSSASGNRVTANGSASVGFEVWYDLPNKGREALVTVTLGFQDDDDRSYSDVIAVKVAP